MPPVISSETRLGAWAPSTTPHAATSTAADRAYFIAEFYSTASIFNNAAGVVYWPFMSVHIVPHPLIHDALIQLRDVNTTTEEFRRIANRISVLLVAEALRDLPTERAIAQTPLERAEGRRVARDVVVVPVLRAGLGMLDAVLELLPAARVGHIGLQRDESTAVASQYYAKLPGNLPSSYVVMVDPMLATGGSAVAGLDVLKKAGAENIRIVCIVAAPEGIALVEKSHPDVDIYTPVVDRGLNAQKYILPGLGDFGDRLYGTC
jgi:uracil phosphoribosyltransferase